MGSECFVFVGTAGEVFTREADGQHSQDQLPSMDKFSNIGRNSLNLDIFSPLNDGKIPDVAPFAFVSLYCRFFSLSSSVFSFLWSLSGLFHPLYRF